MSDPSKTSGQFKSAKGSAVEAVGNATGSDSWKNSGKQDHLEGEGETKAAETKGYVEGAIDRATGIKDSVVGTVLGDQTQKTTGDAQQKKGETKQAFNS